MNTIRRAAVILSAALLAGCTTPTAPETTLPAPAVQALGLMEVQISGLGSQQLMTRATFQPQLNAQGLTSRTSIQFQPDSNGFADRNGVRYVWATFRIRNATSDGTPNPGDLNNLTLLATSVPSGSVTTIADTPLRNMKRFDGSSYAEPLQTTLARSFQPTQKLDTSGALTPLPQGSDLQLFPESAVAENQWTNSAGTAITYADLGVNTMFPYGYVVRNASASGAQERTLKSLIGDPRAVQDQYDGLVTVAVKVPLQSNPQDNPYTFSMVFEVAQDSVTRVTQTTEEQTPSGNATITQKMNTLAATQVSVLPGSTLPTPGAGLSALDVLCSVRLAGPANAPTASIPVPDAGLAVGEVRRLSGSHATVCLPGGSAGSAEYTVIPFNEGGSAQDVTARARNSVSVTGPPTPSISSAAIPLSAPQAEASSISFPQDMAQLADQHYPVFKPVSPRNDLQPQSLPSGNLSLNQQLSLNVAPGCSGSTDNRTGTVVRLGARFAIVTDNNNPAGAYSSTDLDELSTTLETKVWPAMTGAFGEPTDLDGNGHVVVFITRAVNELTPPAGTVVNDGYTDARDLYDTTACTRSNAGEIVYMLTPDPTGVVNSNVRNLLYAKGNFGRVVAHEFQHLINASRRLYMNGATSLEEPWLNEALSGFAEELMFYQDSVGLTPRQNIIVTNLTTGVNASRRVAAFNTYANANYGKFRPFLQSPHSYGPIWTTDSIAGRGAGWNFLRYASDRYASTNSAADSGPGSLTYALVNSTATGMTNLDNALGGKLMTYLRDWSVANYADDAVSGISSEYQHLSWNYRSLYVALVGSFPLFTRPLTADTNLSVTLQPYATSYLRLGVNSGTQAPLLLRTSSGTPAFSYSIIRTK